MFCSRSALFWLTLVLVVPSTGWAQSRGTLKRAEKAAETPADITRVREVFQELSDELRLEPAEATARGWWVRGDLAAALAVRADKPVIMASVALDSYHEALERGEPRPDLAGIESIEGVLMPLTGTAETTPGLAYAASEQMLIALQLRRRIEPVIQHPPDSLHATRVMANAVEAALATGQTRVAQRLFVELDEQGGFIEPLGLQVARRLADEVGPQQAFLFLTRLLENHGNRRKLLIAYIELCAENNWVDEARAGLEKAIPQMKDTYDDQLFLARMLELLQQEAEAEARYKLALRKAPKGFDANLGHASLLVRMASGRAQDLTTPDAEGVVDPEIDPDADPEVVTLRRRAVAALQVALEANPENTLALGMLIDLFRDLDDEASVLRIQERLAGLTGQD